MNERFKLFRQPELRDPSLLVSWNDNTGRLGAKVTGYLSRKLAGQVFAEIEPVEFFPLGGVAVEDNLVQFPEGRFYACHGHNLIIFRSDPPGYQWYKFLDLVLSIARDYCRVKELYILGGMISLGAHNTPRQLVAVFNSPELKEALSQYDLSRELDYKTPPDQRPTLNSFLLWAARRRNLPGVNLWAPIPFYLLAVGDPRAQKRALEFFNRRFDLRIDFSDLDEEIRQQNEKIAGLRNRSREIDQSITKLESNLGLSVEENENLIKGIEEALR